MLRPRYGSSWRDLRLYLVPTLLAAALYLPGIFQKHWMWDAGVYAAVSLNAAREGHWWTLRFGDAFYFNKPPLTFWLRALSVLVFGERPWALRLPEALAALACVPLIVSIARRTHGYRTALIAGLLLALTYEIAWRTSRLRLDFVHTALLLAAVRAALGGLSGGARKRAWCVVLAGVPIGLATLTKPIFGFLAVPLLGIWMALGGRETRRLLPYLGGTLAAALAVSLPWHLSMVVLHGDAFVAQYFGHQTLRRMEVVRHRPWHEYLAYLARSRDWTVPLTAEPGGGGGVRISFYWPMAALVGAAVLWWLGAAALRLAGRSRAAAALELTRRHPRGTLLAQVWTFGFLAALCAFGEKRDWYLIAVFAPAAWVAAIWAAGVLPRGGWRLIDRGAAPLSVLAACATLYLYAAHERGLWPRPDWPPFEKGSAFPPSFDRFYAFLNEHRGERFWSGSMHHHDGGRVYTETGVWVRYRSYPVFVAREEVPEGDLIVYGPGQGSRGRDWPRPDPRDEVVFREALGPAARRRPARELVVVRRAPDPADQ